MEVLTKSMNAFGSDILYIRAREYNAISTIWVVLMGGLKRENSLVCHMCLVRKKLNHSWYGGTTVVMAIYGWH